MAPVSNIRRVVFEIHTNRQQDEDGDWNPYSPFASLPSRSLLLFQLVALSMVSWGVKITHFAVLQHTWHLSSKPVSEQIMGERKSSCAQRAYAAELNNVTAVKRCASAA